VSIASRFFFPASSALRRALLRPAEYSVAASLWQATYGASYVIGPALAGSLISAFGAQVRLGVNVAFLVDALSFGLSALIILLFVGGKASAVDAARQSEARPGTWRDLREGWGIMRRSRPLRGVLTSYSVGLLGVGAVFVLTVPYVQQVFNGDAFQVGLLEAIQSFGLAVGATLVGLVLLDKLQAGQVMLGASLVGALAVIGLGLAPVFGGALVAMCLAGVAAGAVESAGAAVTIHEIPQRHQGKGNSTINSLLNLSYLASVSLAGVGGDLVGVRGTFVIGGAVALLGVLLAFPFLAPRGQARQGEPHEPGSLEI
jgi:MFS transporter, DHA3 family, macrolide efflux protein